MAQRLLFFITWCVLNGCTSSGHVTTPADYHLIPFRTIGQRIPIIKASLNDKSAWFIIDTGASITMLNATEAEYYGFSNWNSLRQQTEISGFSDKLDLAETSFCDIEIGHLKIKHRIFRSLEMNTLFLTIENDERMRIAGIVGSDILATYGINVNYDTRTLSYRIKTGSQN